VSRSHLLVNLKRAAELKTGLLEAAVFEIILSALDVRELTLFGIGAARQDSQADAQGD
jgi:DNA-binding transcriptional regulator LsrR (DeoR family)